MCVVIAMGVKMFTPRAAGAVAGVAGDAGFVVAVVGGAGGVGALGSGALYAGWYAGAVYEGAMPGDAYDGAVAGEAYEGAVAVGMEKLPAAAGGVATIVGALCWVAAGAGLPPKYETYFWLAPTFVLPFW